MAKKVLFEVRERSTDPAFQVIEDDNGVIQTHYGATYASEADVMVGAKLSTDASGNTVLVGAGGSASFNDAGFHGASPVATAAVNSAAIQAALDAGGTVTLITPGTYLVDKTLKIGSHTSLIIGNNVWLKLADSADCALIRNTDCQNALKSSQVSVAGGVATVTEPGHTWVVGDIVYIENADQATFNGAKTITAVSGETWSFVYAGSVPTNAVTSRIFIGRYNPHSGTNFVRASNVVTVTETGHTRQVGDHVYIAGLATDTTFNGMAKITDTTPGISWTYSSAGSDGSPTGTAQLLGNTGIELHGFRYNGNKANQAADLFQAFTAVFCNVGNSYFDIAMATNYWWRGLYLANAGACNIPRMVAENGAVGLQFDSHCNAIDVGVAYGRALSDDILAWGVTGNAGEFGDTACPSGQGSMGTLKVSRINGDSPTGLLKLYCYTGYDLGTVHVGSITGRGRAIAGDATAGVSGGTMTRLVVDHVDASPLEAGQTGIAFSGLTSYGDVQIKNAVDNYTSTATTFFVYASTTVNRLFFDNLFSETYNTSYPVVGIGSGGVVRDLSLYNSRITAGNGGDAIRIFSDATVTMLKINNVEFSGSGAAGSANYYGTMISHDAGGTLSRVTLNGLDLTVGQFSSFLKLSGGAQTVEVDLTNVNSLGNAGKGSSLITDNSSSTSANVRFSNMRFGSGPANNIFQLAGSGTWKIHGAGLHLPVANKFALLTTGTVSVSINCPEVQLDLGANAGTPPARLVPAVGDRIYNTNATGGGLYGRTAAGAWQLIF